MAEMLLLTFLFIAALPVCGVRGDDGRVSMPEGEISILFVILSQNARYDAGKASLLFHSLKKQILDISYLFSQSRGLQRGDVLRTYEDLPEVVGAWAIWPMLESLLQRYEKKSWDWLFICEPDTVVNVSMLAEYLNSFDRNKKYAAGRGLTDETHTIIHHFFDYEDGKPFLYADFAAGLALSWTIFKGRSVPAWKGFTIDAKHELARLLKDELGTTLKNTPSFCLLESESQCIARYVQPSYECANKVTNEDVYFAIKTFNEYHKTRIVIVKRTWAKTGKFVEYFSDVEDHYVPTVTLGHCGKTFGILAYYLKNEEMMKTKWLVITDDDTLMRVDVDKNNPCGVESASNRGFSLHAGIICAWCVVASPETERNALRRMVGRIYVPRLYKLLSCYNARENVIIGERYGYGFSSDGREGYDYPTGGAGMVFSRQAVQKIVAACSCPSIDSPDDMIIGMCARRLRIPVIHSAAFHQAQPQDYSRLYLERIRPISFHKFTNIDPYEVYMEWLYEASVPPASRPIHSEL